MAKRHFTITIDGEVKTVNVEQPTVQQLNNSQKEYNRAFRDALESGALLRVKLDDHMRKQGMWDDDKQLEFNRIQGELTEREKEIAKGGMKLSKAKSKALEMKDLRDQLTALISDRTSMDNNTAEGQADNAKFNYLVSCCPVYDTGDKVFTSLADYLTNANKEVAVESAKTLANMMYGLDNNFEQNLTENKFLLDYGFLNDDMRLVDEDGNLISRDGKKVDEDGFLINDDGHRVDDKGNLLDADGNYMFDSKPFLDDEGNPVLSKSDKVLLALAKEVEKEEKPKPKRGRKPKSAKNEASEE